MNDRRADERRFDDLRESLLRAGVAARTIRRALLEIRGHVDELAGEAMRRGTPKREARAEAHALIGSNERLVARYATRPELRAWCCRWPSLYFTLLPMAAYLALAVAVVGALFLIMEPLSGYLHRTHIPPTVSLLIATTAHVLFLGVLPSAVGTAFSVLARRRRLGFRWPFAGIVLLGMFASLLNVEVVLTGGATPGYAGAGIGISTESLLEPFARAVAVILLAYLSMRFAVSRFDRERCAFNADATD